MINDVENVENNDFQRDQLFNCDLVARDWLAATLIFKMSVFNLQKEKKIF